MTAFPPTASSCLLFDRASGSDHLESLHAGLSQQLVESRNLGARPASSAVGEDNALLGARKCNIETCCSFDLIDYKAPPGAVIEPDENYSVISSPLLLWIVMRGMA